MAKLKGLGRGLDALLGGDEPAAAKQSSGQVTRNANWASINFSPANTNHVLAWIRTH